MYFGCVHLCKSVNDRLLINNYMKVKYKTGRWVVRMAMWLPLVVLSIVAPLSAMAQADELAALRKDFPGLTERYGARLESRTAHYIFAIDISNSMKQYEQTVRNSLISFVNAVPDGDQISIIVMADRKQTDFLDNIMCATLNDAVRRAIVEALRSPRFSFSKDGSDGYTMTCRVLEAMNAVGSSDLTFIYMLTDFEYWTSEHRFDKRAEDWASLKSRLSEKHRGLLCKYGIELNFDKVKHPEAIFKPELDMIFGQLDYRQASSATLLSQWFGHIIDNIRANKINAMLKADWKMFVDSVDLRAKVANQQLKFRYDGPDTALVNGCRIVSTRMGNSHFCQADSAAGKLGKWTELGDYNYKRTFLPGWKKIPADSAEVALQLQSPYRDEIALLQALCNEDVASPDAVRLDYSTTVPVASKYTWNAKWHWAWWLLIVLVILVALAALVYMLFQHPENRSMNIIVRRDYDSFNKFVTGMPVTIGHGGDLAVDGAGWRLRLEAKRYYPLFFWNKTGYYVTLEEGLNAEVVSMIDNRTLTSVNLQGTTLLFPYNHSCLNYVKISEGGTVSKIEVTC